MKLVSHRIGNDTIRVHNNFMTGIETVYFNDRKVARAFNWFHGIHQFRVRNLATGVMDHYRVEFITSFRKWYGVAIDIFKNGELILNQSKRNHGPIYTLDVNEPAAEKRYDRSEWYAEGEAVARPLYDEQDLV